MIETDRAGTRTTDACGLDPEFEPLSGHPASGRIPPHEIRELSSPPPLESPNLRLTMILFEDLSFEGSAWERDHVLEAREQRGVEVAYWSRVFEEAEALPADRVKAFLRRSAPIGPARMPRRVAA